MAGMVTVGCKLPNGIHLDHGNTRVTIKGANHSRIIGGYGLTPDVDKDFWEAWLKEHADFAPVKHGLLFAYQSEKGAEAKAKEQAEVESGFEPINPRNPGPGIQPADAED